MSSRFPNGLPSEIKARLLQEAMAIAIKDQQDTIIRREAEKKYKLDTAYASIGSLSNYNEERLDETIAEAKQAISFFKEIYENANAQYMDIMVRNFGSKVDNFLKTKQKPKIINKTKEDK